MQYAITKSNLPFITPRPNLPVLKANSEKILQKRFWRRKVKYDQVFFRYCAKVITFMVEFYYTYGRVGKCYYIYGGYYIYGWLLLHLLVHNQWKLFVTESCLVYWLYILHFRLVDTRCLLWWWHWFCSLWLQQCILRYPHMKVWTIKRTWVSPHTTM